MEARLSPTAALTGKGTVMVSEDRRQKRLPKVSRIRGDSLLALVASHSRKIVFSLNERGQLTGFTTSLHRLWQSQCSVVVDRLFGRQKREIRIHVSGFDPAGGRGR
jgi:hypothetical protein